MALMQEDVAKIIDLIGGKENIASVSHCVTRLRLLLRDKSKVHTKEIEKLDLVKGCFMAGDQFQIVIGPNVGKVFDEFVRQSGAEEVSRSELKEQLNQRKNPLQRGVQVLADIFIPIIPAIVAAGLLMGLNNLLANPRIFYQQSFLEVHTAWAGFAGIVNMIANTAFTFLPALVGWSAVKKFGGNPVLGIVLGLILVHPGLMSAYDYASDPSAAEYWNLFGFNIAQVGYQGQVLPVLFAAWILAKLEIWLKRVIPDVVQLVFVSPIALLVTGFITFAVIGPITMAGANLITTGIVKLFEVAPVIGGLVYGLISPPLVITGMHHLFLGVNLQMAGTLGYVTLWPIGETATMAQGAAALTMFFILRRDKKMKSVALTATASAWMGITEPAIYGVNLRYRYPFIAVMTASALGSAFLAFFQVKATAVGVGGLLSFLSVFPEYWGIYWTGQLITAAITVGLTLLFFKSKLFHAKNIA